jgi:hypothetical protein
MSPSHRIALASALTLAGCDHEPVAGVIRVGTWGSQLVSASIDTVPARIEPGSDSEGSIDTRLIPDGVHRLEVHWRRDGREHHDVVDVRIANGPAVVVEGGFVETWASSTNASAQPIGRPPFGGTSADIDADGDEDIFVWTSTEAFVLRQIAPLTFERIALAQARLFSTAGFADLDGDGDPDLIAAGSEVVAYENRGGVLSERTDVFARAGFVPYPLSSAYASGITFTDIDADGLVDIALAGFSCSGSRDYVFHNEGNWVFRDVAASLDMVNEGLSTIAFAMDRPEPGGPLHVWSMFEGCLSIGPAHTVFDANGGLPVARSSESPEDVGAYMGSAYFDANGDGALDLWLSLTAANGFYLAPQYRARSGRRFGLEAFPDEFGSFIEQWAVAALDADLDGRTDLFVTQSPSPMNPGRSPHPRLLVRSRGDAFHDVSEATGLLSPREACTSVHASDLDGDGDTDLILGCAQRVRILRNDIVAHGRGTTVVLRGRTSNRDGIDAHLTTRTGEHRLVRAGGNPYASGVRRESLALGDGPLRVTWPSGIEQSVAVDTDSVLTVIEPEAVMVTPRVIEATDSTQVRVAVAPALFGDANAMVRVFATTGAWSDALLHRDDDGVWRAVFDAPRESANIVFTIRIGERVLPIHPTVYVR